jgi:hypothetical protein
MQQMKVKVGAILATLLTFVSPALLGGALKAGLLGRQATRKGESIH